MNCTIISLSYYVSNFKTSNFATREMNALNGIFGRKRMSERTCEDKQISDEHVYALEEGEQGKCFEPVNGFKWYNQRMASWSHSNTHIFTLFTRQIESISANENGELEDKKWK